MSAKKNLIKFVYNTSHNDVSYKQLQNSHICHIIIAKELVSAKKRLQKIPKIPEIPEIPGLQQKTTKKDYKKKTTKKASTNWYRSVHVGEGKVLIFPHQAFHKDKLCGHLLLSYTSYVMQQV